MNYKQTYNKNYVMDINVRDTLSRIGNAFDSNKNPSETDCREYYDTFIKYIEFVRDYCDNEFKGQTYSDNQIIPQVFVMEIKKEQAFKQYLRHSLYCAKLYVDFLKDYIKEEYIHRYKTLRLNLICDMEWLLAKYEVYNKGVNKCIELTCGARPEISSLDMIWVLRELTIIENAPDIKDIALRDILPYRIFVVRQLLETLGKNIIGYSSIYDCKGKPIHKFTQISWEFLHKYSKNKDKQWSIELPFEISSIHAINKWSNSFVHTGYIKASYIQYYAVTILNKLMAPPQKSVKCHDGKNRTCLEYGDFRINGYDYLKSDFEKYIKSKNPDSVIDWKPEDKVGAYIITK